MSPGRQAAWWTGGIAVFGVLLLLLSDVLLPFVAGMAVAYFLDPVVDKLETWKLSRTAATIVVTLVFFAVLLLALVLVAPLLYEQVTGFSRRLPGYIERIQTLVMPLVADLLGEGGQGEVGKMVAGAAFDIAGVVGRVLKGIWSSGLAIVNIVSLIVITPVVSFYLLRDWDLMVARVDGWLPRAHAPVIRELAREIDQVLAAFVRGTGTVCLGLAVIYAVALSVVGLEFGLVVGLISGFASFIPFVGALLGLFVSGALAVAQFWPDYVPILIVLAIFIAGQVLEGNFLTPHLVGDKVGLHPVWVIFALLAGGALFGFVGVLLAMPIAAAGGVLVRFALRQYTESFLYLGSGGDGGSS